MIRNLLFDLDGTLTDPALGITNSILYALEKMGKPLPPREELYKFIGPPLIPSFQKFLGMTAEEAALALATYREYFSVSGLFENDPYPGIADALAELKAAGLRLYVTTSKPEPFAVRILEHFSLDGYFDRICGASMDEKRVSKADVIRYTLETNGLVGEEAESMMIGDRCHDIAGAKETGLASLGVLWGYGSRDELAEAGADYIADDIPGMVSLIRPLAQK